MKIGMFKGLSVFFLATGSVEAVKIGRGGTKLSQLSRADLNYILNDLNPDPHNLTQVDDDSYLAQMGVHTKTKTFARGSCCNEGSSCSGSSCCNGGCTCTKG